MRASCVVALIVVQGMAFSLGCDSEASAPNDSPLALRPLHAAPDVDQGGRIVDDRGRTVLLRGVNVNALAEYWKGGEFDTTFPLTDADIDMIAAIGWNTVRLLLSWSRVEPSPGGYDDAYLAQVDDAIERFAQRGIYTIVDLHQDAWGPTLAARDDEVCPSGQQPAFGWDGAPAWATLDNDAPRCTIGPRELSPAVRAAWEAFWTDAMGPGDVGIRTRYVQMLGMLARRYATWPAVAGYDVMNEPNAFGPAENQALSDLYAAALRAIREGEANGGGSAHLVLFEPSALWSTVGSGAPPDFERDRDVVYSPHVYTGGFTSGAITRAAFDVAVTEAQGFGGAPILSGEWGSGPGRAGPDGDGYFLDHQTLQDDFQFSATLWTWREACGDPHLAGAYRDGHTPSPWGEFDVNCTTNEVIGVRQHLVDELTRAYVRAAPGTLATSHYDNSSGAFEATGTSNATGALLVAFYPTTKHSTSAIDIAATITTTGLANVRTLEAPGDNTFIVGEARGGAWSVSITPPAP